MSKSHVMVLPSVEEGFGMVQAQAVACGGPVIATVNTGAPDLFKNEVEGYIVPVRDPCSIADRLQRLADNRQVHDQVLAAALASVTKIGGWGQYGEHIQSTSESLKVTSQNLRRAPADVGEILVPA